MTDRPAACTIEKLVGVFLRDKITVYGAGGVQDCKEPPTITNSEFGQLRPAIPDVIGMDSQKRVLPSITFGTRNRKPSIRPEFASQLFAYMGGICRNLGVLPIRINGPEDHVHVFVSLPPTMSVSDFVRFVKSNSSRWVHENFPAHRGFKWPSGFGAFSVDPEGVSIVSRYVETQQEHHRKKTFQNEYKALLEEYGITYDEKYMWD